MRSVLELQRTARNDSPHAIEAEPGGGNPLSDLALAGVEIGTGEVAGDRRPAALTASRSELNQVRRSAKSRSPIRSALGMELLERLRELVAELLDRPVGDRPAHPAVVACLLRQPLLLEQAAVLVLAAAAARARSVPGRLRHHPERYERRADGARPGTGGPARYSPWPSRPCPEATFNTGSTEPCARSSGCAPRTSGCGRCSRSLSSTKTILDPSKPEPPPSGPGSPASADEKVALVRRLFRGRDDVYALRWESARTGKSGYAPATAEGWSRHGPKTYLPMSDEAIERHLRGRESIGVYPLLAGRHVLVPRLRPRRHDVAARCARAARGVR